MRKNNIRLSKEEAICCPTLEKNNLGKREIYTECVRPIVSPMYRLGHELEKEAKKIIEKHLREGIIRESSSPWRSPIVMRPKKNGEYRLCID